MAERDPSARIAAALSPEVHARGLSLYVALGDSFTAGTGCEPGRAWPDLLAAWLRRRHPEIAFRNLAQHGATSAAVTEQLRDAVELEPDVVTVVFGANDVLGSTRPDTAAYERALARVLRALARTSPAIRIATATAPERWDFLELRPRTSARVARGIADLNEATRRIARAHGAACLDVAGHPGLSQPENFTSDGLHPSALGHVRAARGFARLFEDTHGI